MNSLPFKIAAVLCYVALCTALALTLEEPAAVSQQAASEPISSAAPAAWFARGQA